MKNLSLYIQPYKTQGVIFLWVISLFVVGTFWVHRSQTAWGLKGRYYANPDWQGTPTISRIDNQPYLKGLTGYQLLATHFYTVKWTGWIVIKQTGAYKFATYSDDGSVVQINGKPVIDNSGTHGLKKVSAIITMEKGVYPIEVLYLQMGGFSFMQLLWAPPGEPEGPIPAHVLFSKCPARFNLLLRTGVSLLTSVVTILWGGLLLLISLAILIKILKRFGIVPVIKHHLSVYCQQNRFAIALTGVFLGGILLTVYTSQNQPVIQTDQLTWTAQANPNSADAKFALDRQPDTRWTTYQPMRPGMFFQLDLGQPTRIEKLTLLHSWAVNEYPRGYRVEISPDQIHWQPATLVDCQASPDATHILISPCQMRYLKITQTWYSQESWWSMHELYLYHPSWLPRAYQYPLLLLCLCGLLGSILFISLSWSASLQSCGNITLIRLVFVTMVGFLLRIFMVHTHFFDVDESDYLSFIRLPISSDIAWLKQIFFQGDVTRTPLLHLLCARWLIEISNHFAFSIRLMSVILGTLTIPLIFVVWHRVNSQATTCYQALLAAALVSVFAYHVCWSRDGHGELNATFFYILYILVGSHTFTARASSKTIFWGTGLFLFLGFWFHGIITIAPVGIVLFALGDLIITKLRIARWQPFQWKQYLPLFLSSMLFAGYCYYVLYLKLTGGVVNSTTFSGSGANIHFTTLSGLLIFLKTRWHCVVHNLTQDPWLSSYGFPGYFSKCLAGLALPGIIAVIVKRQKSEWFVLLQSVLFVAVISSIETTGTFERHYPIIILPITYFVARGITVISRCVPGPRWVAISRHVLGSALVIYFLFVTISSIFIAPPRPNQIAYHFYGGREGSFSHLMRHVQRSPYASNPVIILQPAFLWLYSNLFKLSFTQSDISKVNEFITRDERLQLPRFLLVDKSHHRKNPEDFLAIEQHYAIIGSSRDVAFTLYELRDTGSQP
jgi:hypothetical protein